MVVPPRARSANPTAITASAAAHNPMDLVRGFIRALFAEDSAIAR